MRGEFTGSTVMKTFEAEGHGLLPIPQVLNCEVARQYGVEVLGRVDEVREWYYVITLQRRAEHPALAAMTLAAREELFAAL